MKKFLTLTIIAIIALIALTVSVNAVDMTASAFLEDMEDGEMSADVRLTEQVVVNEDMTFDLNGYTLTMTENANISVQKGELTVKNGTVIAEGYAFRVEASEGNAVLNIESDVEATAGDCAVFIKKEGSVLNTSGNLVATGEFATISGNGNEGNGGIEVNITGGSVTHDSVTAVYFPNTTTLNISGGVITGATAVYHKSGELNITDGELNGTGTKAEYVHNNNGCDETGDALVIEACDYSGGVPVVSITGGVFTSENNQAIGYYQQTEDYKLANEKFITGGEFNQDVSEYVPAGYVVIEIAADLGLYKVKLNTPYVTNDHVTDDDTLFGEIEIGVVSELQGELEEIFEQEIEKNSTLKEALLAGKSVNIHVQIDKVNEEEVDEEELKAIKETVEDENLVKFYDITLVIKADGQEIGTIADISNKLKFRVLIPEDLIKDGRTFFMYRYHEGENGGEVKRLDGIVDEDNYFVFETDKFSTYALAYEDKTDETTTGQGTTAQKPAEDEKDKTPETGSVDVILFVSAIVAVVSLAGVALVRKYTR